MSWKAHQIRMVENLTYLDICQGLETLMYLKHLSTQAAQSVIKAHKPYPSKPNLATDTGYQGLEFSFIESRQETEVCIGFR